MKEIFESWLGIFFLAILMVGGISIINAGIDARNADASKSGYIAEIENSNFSAEVMRSVFAEAESEGYELSIDLYHETLDGQRRVDKGITSGDAIPDTSDVYMARLHLGFNYSFVLFDVAAHHELIGYAR